MKRQTPKPGVGGDRYLPFDQRTGERSVVYFTRDLSAQGLKKLYDRVKTFLEEIHYVGFANIDMKYSAKRDEYYMMEINPRLGRSSFFLRAAGLNMMKIMTDDCIYSTKCDVVRLDSTSFWANVPKCVIKKYVKNEEIKREIKELIKQKKYMRTLDCKNDRDIRRVLRIKKYYYGQYKNFKNYYFEKNEDGVKK